jgi:hypothetical protein
LLLGKKPGGRTSVLATPTRLRDVGTQSGTPRLEAAGAALDRGNADAKCKFGIGEYRTAEGEGRRASGMSPKGTSPRRISRATAKKSRGGKGASQSDGNGGGGGMTDAATAAKEDLLTEAQGGGSGGEKKEGGAEGGTEGVRAGEEGGEYTDSEEDGDMVETMESEQMKESAGMFQGISDAVVASEWNSYWHAGWRIRGRTFLRSKTFNFFVFVFTLYAILGLELCEASIGSSAFLVLHVSSFICFLFFSFEIIFTSLVTEVSAGFWESERKKELGAAACRQPTPRIPSFSCACAAHKRPPFFVLASLPC